MSMHINFTDDDERYAVGIGRRCTVFGEKHRFTFIGFIEQIIGFKKEQRSCPIYFGQLFFYDETHCIAYSGCKLNYAETATVGRQFLDLGYTIVDMDQSADVVVINTCSVTENADRECRQVVRRALRRSPNAFVAVIGCYAQLKPEELASIEGVDLVLGTKENLTL